MNLKEWPSGQLASPLNIQFPRREQKLRAGKVYFAKPVKMFSKAVSPSRRPSSETHHHLTTALSSACAGPVLQNCGNYLLFWQCFFPTPQSILDALLVSLTTSYVLRPRDGPSAVGVSYELGFWLASGFRTRATDVGMSPAECLRGLPTRSPSDGHESISKFQAPPSRSEILTRHTGNDSIGSGTRLCSTTRE
jgi:hypothetical protein